MVTVAMTLGLIPPNMYTDEAPTDLEEFTIIRIRIRTVYGAVPG